MNKIQFLSDNLDLSEVGGKAYSLSQMTSAGINVPSGFVLTKYAYQTSLEDLKSLISPYLNSLNSKYVMVRSSAIGEDSFEASFAGQLESYQTNNHVDEVTHNIIKCWHSLSSDRVEEYGKYQGKTLSEMAVVIQEMIEPEYAGVFFTTSPITQEGFYLEYVTGHAEKLVQGEVTPESLQIDSLKNVKGNLPFDVKNLIAQGRRILKAYKGVPQDIEWAYKNKKFYFVQSRPITTLKTKLKWSNTNVNENYPNKLSPLLYSIAKQSYYHYYKNLALELGVLEKDNPGSERYFSNAIGIFGHRMYYNMSSIHKIIELSPLAGLLQKSFDDFVGYQKKNDINNRFNSILHKIKIMFRLLGHLLTLETKVERIELAVGDYADKNKKERSFSELIDSFHNFLFIRFHLWVNASFADFFAMLFHGSLGKFLIKAKIENASGIQNGLIQGIPNLISNRPLLELWKIQKIIQKNGDFQQLFEQEAEHIWTKVQSDERFLPILEQVNHYLDHWGYRCPGELTFLTENYIENPIAFIKMIKTYRNSSPETPQKLLDLKHADQVNLLYETSIQIRRTFKFRPLLKFIYPKILKLLTKLTIFSVSCRERVRLKQAQMYYTFKHTCQLLGKTLVEKDILKEAQDIFYLEYTEINKITSGEEVDTNYIQKIIEARKESLANSKEAPDNISNYQEEFGRNYQNQDKKVEAVDGVYKGLPACNGRYSGKVVVVKDLNEINKIKKGDILVTKQTDPGWICVFPMISGIIVEKGGVLSHSAIVAREFGIPAVVGIPHITELLSDGQDVEVNGDTGEVRCLD